MFVRIQFPVGEPHPAVLVTDRAIGTDQGVKFVYVVDSDHKVQYRKIKLGALQDDGLRAIDEGVKADDWVVIGGLQQVRPRMEVRTEESTMPSLESSSEKTTPASSATKVAPAESKVEAPAKPAAPPAESKVEGPAMPAPPPAESKVEGPATPAPPVEKKADQPATSPPANPPKS